MSIKKNTIFNLVGSAVPMVIGLICIPYLLKKIGIESFGVLSLIWMLIGYFGLFDLGIGRALTQKIAKHNEALSLKKIKDIIFAGLIVTLIFGILGGFILAIISHILAYQWLGVSKNLQESVFYSILIVSVGIPLATVTSGLRGVLEGYMDFNISNIIKIIFGALNFVVPIIIVYFFNSKLETIAFGLVLSRVLILFLHLYYVKEKVNFKDLNMKMEDGFQLLRFGSWMTVSAIIGPLMVIGDRFIISNILGANVVALYTIPFDTIIRILIIPTSLTAALFPKFAFLNDINDIRRVYRQSIKFLIVIMVPICLILMIFSKLILSIWLGNSIASESWPVLSILAIGIFFNSLAQLPFVGLQANEHVKTTAAIHMSEFFFYIPILLLSLKYFGLYGAAWAWSLRCLIDYLILKMQFFKQLKFNNNYAIL